jgi:hypothetical protein
VDDFHVGSVPSTELFGNRRAPDTLTRRRQPRHGEEQGDSHDEPADTFETLEAAVTDSDASGESIEDYYLPSDPSGE